MLAEVAYDPALDKLNGASPPIDWNGACEMRLLEQTKGVGVTGPPG